MDYSINLPAGTIIHEGSENSARIVSLGNVELGPDRKPLRATRLTWTNKDGDVHEEIDLYGPRGGIYLLLRSLTRHELYEAMSFSQGTENCLRVNGRRAYFDVTDEGITLAADKVRTAA